MESSLALRLVPDDLWELVEPLLPRFETRWQGGGTAPIEDRAVFTAVVYVLTSGCAWRHLPTEFGVSVPTAHRRFQAWTRAGVWPRLHRAVLDAHGVVGQVDWSSVIVDAASLRAKKGSLTGPNPVDRGKAGSKLHVLTDGAGLPLVVAVSTANLHDSQVLIPLVASIPAIRSRRGPRRRRPDTLRADKAYDQPELRRFLRRRRITVRIARRGVESTERLGRYRWKIERTIAWLDGYRRLTIRYERNGRNFLGFLSLAAAITCWKKLPHPT
ncbi:IS5 family transposase [Parafrankia sp. Ea1.12]|uniref:IS5 family transposase n=1 Tax=Parafrankia sp. Ea1.12 TaxID=573499 RepID=UPI000DD38275|nr:IS5 family transposase [Parafrankia sp. Ea1.12]